MIFNNYFKLYVVTLLFLFANDTLSITEEEIVSHLNRFLVTLELNSFEGIRGKIGGKHCTLEDLFSNIKYKKFDLSNHDIPPALMNTEYLAVNLKNYKIKRNIIYVLLKCKYFEIIKTINRLLWTLCLEYNNLSSAYSYQHNEILELDESNSISLDDIDFEQNDTTDENSLDLSQYNNDFDSFSFADDGFQKFYNKSCNDSIHGCVSNNNSDNSSDFVGVLTEKTVSLINMVTEMIDVVLFICSFYEDDKMQSITENPFLIELKRVQRIKLPNQYGLKYFSKQLKSTFYYAQNLTPPYCDYAYNTPSKKTFEMEFKKTKLVKDFPTFLFSKIDWVVEDAMRNYILPFKKPKM